MENVSLLRSLFRLLGGRRWVARLVAPVLGRLDTAVLHHGHQLTPFPTLLLETNGRHSATLHESPLWYLRDGYDYVVIATNFGRREPDWSLNLRADQSCRFVDGRVEAEAIASLVTGTDWDRLFEGFADFYPPYRRYLDRVDRDVPIWRLRIR